MNDPQEMNEKDLLELKEEIEDAKVELSNLEGRRDSLLEQLEEEWDCVDLIEAENKLSELETELEEIQEKISQEISKITEEYEKI